MAARYPQWVAWNTPRRPSASTSNPHAAHVAAPPSSFHSSQPSVASAAISNGSSSSSALLVDDDSDPPAPKAWPKVESKYKATYDDRELPDDLKTCSWQVERWPGSSRFKSCGQTYATLDLLSRHLEQGHLAAIAAKLDAISNPKTGSKRGRPAGPNKILTCKMQVHGSKKICGFKPSNIAILKRHLQEVHFTSFSHRCKYVDCTRAFESRDARNAHHDDVHRSDEHSDPRRPHFRMTEMKKRNFPKIADPVPFSSSFPFLHAALKHPQAQTTLSSISASEYSFGETIEVPAWAAFFISIRRVAEERPAEARAKALRGEQVEATSSQNDGGLARTAASGSSTTKLEKAATGTTESSSEVEADADNKRSRPTFQNPWRIPRHGPVPDGTREKVKKLFLRERHPGRFPEKLVSYEQPARGAIQSQQRDRTYKHPLLAALRKLEDMPDAAAKSSSEGDDSDAESQDSGSISDGEWLQETKREYQTRKLTRREWKQEQRELRTLLYPDASDADSEPEAFDTRQMASALASTSTAIKRSPKQRLQQGASTAAGPSRLKSTQAVASRAPTSGSLQKGNFGPLPSIPKKVIPPPGAKQTAVAARPASRGPGPQASSSAPHSLADPASALLQPLAGPSLGGANSLLPAIPKLSGIPGPHASEKPRLTLPNAVQAGPSALPPAAAPAVPAPAPASDLSQRGKAIFAEVSRHRQQEQRARDERARAAAEAAQKATHGASSSDAITILDSDDSDYDAPASKKYKVQLNVSSTARGEIPTPLPRSSSTPRLFGPKSKIHAGVTAGRYGEVDSRTLAAFAGSTAQAGSSSALPSSSQSPIKKSHIWDTFRAACAGGTTTASATAKFDKFRDRTVKNQLAPGTAVSPRAPTAAPPSNLARQNVEVIDLTFESDEE